MFDIEAGCKKTRTAERALVEGYDQGRNAILVRRTDNDCRESMKNINMLAGKEIAFAYNNEDVPLNRVNDMNRRLRDIPVIIITHQKYIVLMQDKSKRRWFIQGRTTLIIDEFLSTVNVIALSRTDIDMLKAILIKDPILSQEFEKVMCRLIDALVSWEKEQWDNRFVTFSDKAITKKINDFIKLLKANMTNEMLKKEVQVLQWNQDFIVNKDLLNAVVTVKGMCDQMLKYKELLTNICLYHNKKLYTTDKRYGYWFLDNNIMLDASGELQIAYSLNQEEFLLRHCEKVLDHSRWKIINIPVTTTTAVKEKMLNFYDVVNTELQRYGNDILVVGKKDEMAMINVPEENKGYFGNITGSNQWYDVKNVAIIQTHNLNDVDYILKYLHYSKSAIDEALSLQTRSTGRADKRIYSFCDPRLERVRAYWIASEIYQAVKRVNRNMKYDTEVLIFINNKDVIDLLRQQMKNIAVETIEYGENRFAMKETKQDKYVQELKQKSHARKFIQFLSEVQNGLHQEYMDEKRRIAKAQIREYLGIKTSSNFSTKVLKNTEVIAYCQARKIDLTGKYIKFLNEY